MLKLMHVILLLVFLVSFFGSFGQINSYNKRDVISLDLSDTVIKKNINKSNVIIKIVNRKEIKKSAVIPNYDYHLGTPHDYPAYKPNIDSNGEINKIHILNIFNVYSSIFLSASNFNKITFDTTVSFVGDTFNSNFNAIYSKFKACNISNCICKGKENFSTSIFNGQVEFGHNMFRDSFIIFNGSFYYYISFRGNTFDSCVNINATSFLANSSFISDTFNSKFITELNTYKNLSFTNCVFNNFAKFTGSHFDSIILISNTTFANALDFKTCVFHNDVLLEGDKFNKKLDFSKSTIDSDVNFNFYNTILPDTIDFSYIKDISKEIDLTSANFHDSSRIDHTDTVNNFYFDTCRYFIRLYKSDIPKFHLDYTHFQLLLIDDNGKRLKGDEAIAVYEQLLKNFKDHGQMESYEKLDIEYQRFKDKTPRKIFYRLNSWWWNCSYDKQLIFMHTFLLLLFFTVIVFFIIGFLNNEVYALDNIKKFPFSIWLQVSSERITENQNNINKNAVAAMGYFHKHNKTRKLPNSIFPKTIEKENVDNDVKTVSKKYILYSIVIFLTFFITKIKFVESEIVYFFIHGQNSRSKFISVINSIIDLKKIIIIIVIVFISSFLFGIYRTKKTREYILISLLSDLLLRLWYSFVYTCTLFFPLFLKIEKIKYRHKFAVLFIFFVYTVGLLCVGYMTNFVLQK